MPPHTPINKTMSPREPLLVNNVVQDCMPIIEHLAGSKGIECRIEVSDDMPVLFADRSSITQILINLLTNAIKFSGEGATVTLQITATNFHNIFKIIDTGRGIPEDKISTLTDPFARTESDPHLSQEGTGLGLTIVNSLTELHGVTLDIKSKVG